MKTMKVRPNPWGIHPKELQSNRKDVHPSHKVSSACVDARGRPACVVMVDPKHSPMIQKFVGAAIDRDITYQTGEVSELKAASLVLGYKFLGVSVDHPDFAQELAKAEPVEVPLTDHYTRSLKTGKLLPADRISESFAGYRVDNLSKTYADLEQLARKVFDENRSAIADCYDDLRKVRCDSYSKMKSISKEPVAPSNDEPAQKKKSGGDK